MPHSISQNAGSVALAVVYHEDPEVLLEEHFQLPKNSPYIHQQKYNESMDGYKNLEGLDVTEKNELIVSQHLAKSRHKQKG